MPLPELATLKRPGLAVAVLIRSGTDSIRCFCAKAGLSTSTLGTPAHSVTGAKSLTWSYGIFGYSAGLIACVPTVPISSV